MIDLYRYYRLQAGFVLLISLFLTFGTSPLVQDASAGETDWEADVASSITSVTKIPAANDPPVAKADTFATPENTTLGVGTPGVLANDSDSEDDTLTAALVDSTDHGAITLNDDGSFEYAPDSGFTGTDGFTYEAVDDSSASDTASVRIEVVPNSPPTVAVSLPRDTMKVPGPPLQLTNLGQSVFTDPNGDTLSFEATSSNPSAVQVLDQSPRVVILKPQQAGTAEITITASDGQADTSDTFTAVVEQRSPNDPVPSAQAKAVLDTTGAEEAAVNFGTTGGEAVFEGVDTQGSIEVSFFPNIGSDTSGTQAKTTEVDTFENVSTYAWQFDNQGTSFDSVDVSFALGDTSVTGVGNPETVKILRDADDDGTYDQVLSTSYSDGGTPSDSTDDVLTGEGIPGFSTFKLASNDSGNSLPVELASFDAEVHGEETYLSWRTASERSNAGFQVQRKSGSQGDWTNVGFVASKASGGTTTESQTYRFRDADLPYESDRLTYRLKQVDTDGSSSFSKTTTVRRGVDKVKLLETYPNPAQTQATVRYALPEARDVKLVLYNVLGQKVQTAVQAKQGGRHKRQIDVSGLPSGTYFLRLRADGETKTRRLTVVR